jgi:hypothetical protein
MFTTASGYKKFNAFCEECSVNDNTSIPNHSYLTLPPHPTARRGTMMISMINKRFT